MKPLRKRIVDLSAIASGEDRDAAVFFYSLEEIIDLDIDVTIVAVLQFGTFAKKRISFVEKEDRTILLCCSEDAPQILFRLANIFRDDGAQIDAVQVFSQISGQSLCSDESDHSAFAGEQDADAFPVRRLANALALCLRTAFCANECHRFVQGCPKTGRQTQLGFGPVLRINKDLPVSVPHPIIFEPFPFALCFADLLSLPSLLFSSASRSESTMSGQF